MYGESFEVDDKVLDPDFVLPIGKAHIAREGKDLTIITFSRCVGKALKAAEELAKEGISIEVINLRTLRPMDTDTIIKSVKKTHRAITLEDGWPQCGVGAEISAVIMESKFLFFLLLIL